MNTALGEYETSLNLTDLSLLNVLLIDNHIHSQKVYEFMNSYLYFNNCEAKN